MRCVALLIALLLSPVLHAEVEGRIEAGLGAFSLVQPNYRGSDHYHVLALPFPYLSYQSDKLRVSAEGANAKLFASDRLNLNISLSANFNSGKNDPPRTGMPKLVPTFEAGPSLDVKLWRSQDLTTRLRLRIPVRSVVATNARQFSNIGWVFNPHFAATRRSILGDWYSVVSATVGPTFATRNYNAYFYSVDSQFVTPERPGYQAKAGYGGSRVSLSWSLARERWRFGVFGSAESLQGAVFERSPLVETKRVLGAGLFINYRLYQNKPQREISEADAVE